MPLEIREVFFASNRMPILKKGTQDVIGFADAPSPVDGLYLRYGIASVDATGAPILPLYVAPENLFPDDAMTPNAAAAPTVLGSADVLNSLRNKILADDRSILVIVHGFNNSFDESIAAAAKLSRAMLDKFHIFAFCWPSINKQLGYGTDQRRAANSGAALARVLERAVAFIMSLKGEDRCGRKIHVLAHSMGNQVLRHAVQAAVATYRGRLPPLFDQAILAAADEDADALSSPDKLAPLVGMCNRVTVYHTRKDLAMDVSDWTKGNPDRLGAGGPANMSGADDRVVAVDATRAVINDKDAIDHGYYNSNQAVTRDILETLTGVPPSRREKTDIPGRYILNKA